MNQLLPVLFGVAAILVYLYLPPKPFEIKHLPLLFSDEEQGVAEYRPDLACTNEADECYRICLLKCYITYAIRRSERGGCELIEVTYRGRPGPVLEMEDDRPLRFLAPGARTAKTHFNPRERRDVAAFVNTVRTLVFLNRAPD